MSDQKMDKFTIYRMVSWTTAGRVRLTQEIGLGWIESSTCHQTTFVGHAGKFKKSQPSGLSQVCIGGLVFA